MELADRCQFIGTGVVNDKMMQVVFLTSQYVHSKHSRCPCQQRL